MEAGGKSRQSRHKVAGQVGARYRYAIPIHSDSAIQQMAGSWEACRQADTADEAGMPGQSKV
jgi:hypothetical protein